MRMLEYIEAITEKGILTRKEIQRAITLYHSLCPRAEMYRFRLRYCYRCLDRVEIMRNGDRGYSKCCRRRLPIDRLNK